MAHLRELPCNVEFDDFVGVADTGMQGCSVMPMCGGMSRFLKQLASRSLRVGLANIDFPGGQFNKMSAHRIAELMLEEQGVVVDEGRDDHSAWMQHIFTP